LDYLITPPPISAHPNPIVMENDEGRLASVAEAPNVFEIKVPTSHHAKTYIHLSYIGWTFHQANFTTSFSLMKTLIWRFWCDWSKMLE
jgi:hypothetical protein